MSQGGATISCVECGKRYAFRPELRGKRVRCPCGATMTVEEPASDDSAPAENAEGEATDRGTPAVARPVPTSRSIPAYARFTGRRRDARDMASDVGELGLAREWVLPGVALALGLVGRVWQVSAVTAAHDDFGVGSVVVVVAIELLFATIAAVIAFVMCLRLFDLDPENPGRTLFKLLAIVSLTGVVQFFGGWIGRGPMSTADVTLGLPSSWVVTALLLGLFFGYHAWDAWRVAAIVYVMRIVALLGILGAVGATRGRAMLLGM